MNVFQIDEKDMMSITDSVKAKVGNFFVDDWLINRNTLEFMDAREAIITTDINDGPTFGKDESSV